MPRGKLADWISPGGMGAQTSELEQLGKANPATGSCIKILGDMDLALIVKGQENGRGRRSETQLFEGKHQFQDGSTSHLQANPILRLSWLTVSSKTQGM